MTFAYVGLVWVILSMVGLCFTNQRGYVVGLALFLRGILHDVVGESPGLWSVKQDLKVIVAT